MNSIVIRGVDILKLKHTGLRCGSMHYFNWIQHETPERRDMKPSTLELQFNDIYEIEKLIRALEQFKNDCMHHVGEWKPEGKHEYLDEGVKSYE